MKKTEDFDNTALDTGGKEFSIDKRFFKKEKATLVAKQSMKNQKSISQLSSEFIINTDQIIKGFTILAFFIVMLSISVNLYKFTVGHDRYLVRLFDLDAEWNVPTLFSSFLAFSCAFTLFFVAALKKRNEDFFFLHWTILSLAFLYISIDEILVLHEQIIVPLRNLLNLSGVFYFSWVVPAGIILILMFIFFLPFLIKLSKRYKIIFILSGIVYISGGLGFELIGGYYAEKESTSNIIYSILNNIEETMEICGMIIFLYGLLDYIKYYYPDFSLKLLKIKKN